MRRILMHLPIYSIPIPRIMRYNNSNIPLQSAEESVVGMKPNEETET